MSETKICTMCKIEKELIEFNKNHLSKDGLTTRCKGCLRITKQIHYTKNKEKVLLKNKTWRLENSHKCKERRSKYYQANKEQVNIKSALWVKNNPEKVKLTRDRYAIHNIDTVRAQKRAWSKRNPESARLAQHRRRARKLENGGEYTFKDIEVLLLEQDQKCKYCNTDIVNEYHIDHILPIVLKGSNDLSNIQLLCPSCNQRKGSKPPEDFFILLEYPRL